MLILTPNKRLALYLQKQKQSKNFGQAGSITAFSAWIEYLWDLCRKENPQLPVCISPYESAMLWENIIKASPQGQTVLGLNSIVKRAHEAHQLIGQWNIAAHMLNSNTDDEQAFLSWRTEYLLHLEQNHYCDHTQLLSLLMQNISAFQAVLPKHILCIGFNEWTPQQLSFWQHLEERGVKRSEQHFTQTPSSIAVQACLNPEHELQNTVLQAKAWLSEKEKKNKAHVSERIPIGIVVPDLEHRREAIEAAFLEQLPKQAFNIAAPLALAQYPLIISIFTLLRLLFYKNTLQQLSLILRCPYIFCSQQESFVLSSVDILISEKRKTEYSLEEWIYFLNQHQNLFETLNENHFLNRLKNLQSIKKEMRGRKRAEVWVELIKQCLNILEWTQHISLTPEESLIKVEWEKLLEQYLQLDRTLGPHTFTQSIHHLRELSQTNAYLPSQQAWAPIQILGMLEGIGLPFENLMVLGLHQEFWPKSQDPNPFLSIFLQRKLNCPRSSPKREYEMALQYTERLCQAGENIIFLYPSSIEDRVVKVSPLLRHLEAQPPSIFEAQKPSSYIVQSETQETTEFGSTPSFNSEGNSQSNLQSNLPSEPLDSGTLNIALDPIPNPSNKGTVQALKLQAHCPFKAFSEIRLNAKPGLKSTLGLTKAERGEITHDVLALFWEHVKTQANLNCLSETALTYKLKEKIDFSLERFEKRTSPLNHNYRHLEQQRLCDLILGFLQLEKARPNFEVIASEYATECTIGDLKFKFRIDRIDQLEDGQELLLDYKTGFVEVSSWFKDPILDPQLPLYYLARMQAKPNQVVGFSFILLKPNEIKFQGIAKHELNIPGIKCIERINQELTWEAQSQTFEHSILKLAHDFKAGIVNIAPIEEEKTCRQCTLSSLCRKLL